jgi:hypothetical protein
MLACGHKNLFIYFFVIEFTRIQLSDYSTGGARKTPSQCENNSHDMGDPYCNVM